MKNLILLRHAKSSWVNPDLDDFDRPLNKRGKRSAKALGKWLRASNWSPDHVLCSAARRTRETWEGLKLEGTLELRQDLYHASPDGLLAAIRGAQAETLLVLGHNPGIGALAHMLLKTAPAHPRFEDYPTGALLVASFDVERLEKLDLHSGTAAEFLTPHDLFEPRG